MKLFQMSILVLALGFLPTAGAAQLTEDQVTAAEVAPQALIDRGAIPGIDQLSTYRVPGMPQEYSDNTDRILQGMGADLVPGRVTGYLCEPAPPARNERTGEMEEYRVCRFDDGRKPVLFYTIEVWDSEAVVPISAEGVSEIPTANCMWVYGATSYVRLVRTDEGGWKFDEVFQIVADDGFRDCKKKPGLR